MPRTYIPSAPIKGQRIHETNGRTKDGLQPIPGFTCSKCSKCVDSRCLTFNRHVSPKNRCFYHSEYQEELSFFKAPDNLEEIMERETGFFSPLDNFKVAKVA